MKTRFFTPFNKNKGQNSTFKYLLCFSLLTLSGCVTTENIAPLAPAPPAINPLSLNNQNQIIHQPLSFAPIPQKDVIQNIKIEPIQIAPIAPQISSLKECSIKDRFDRKSILAYEWNRHKLMLDVDGINLKKSSKRGIFLKYSLHIHNEKTRKQKCRYPSKWQGLLGSGYNEIFIRKDKKMWQKIKNKLKLSRQCRHSVCP